MVQNQYLIFGITYAFAAAVQPGPFQTYIISQTIKQGWRSTLPAAFAPIISDGPILILILSLLSSVPDPFIYGLRVGGGLFLLYLAYKAYVSWKTFSLDEAFNKTSRQQTLLNAVVVNVLNPNPYLGWSLIMGPLFLEGWHKQPIYGISLITAFYMTLVLTTIGIIILFTFARKLGAPVSKALIGISALALFAFGCYQLWIGLTYYL